MIKSFLISISFSTLLFSSQQILLVVADDFNSSKAKLSCFEGKQQICKDIDVNLGKNGLGWGIGIKEIPHKKNEPLKYEGDKRAPAGIFQLTESFGYTPHQRGKLPYLYTDKNLICIDDSNSPFYNQIIQSQGNEKSFEYMKRKDTQYQIGVVVAHNPMSIEKRGSCIFLHVQKSENHPTVGCTSMKQADLKRIIAWLDKKKNPILIQIPKKYLTTIKKFYPELK